MGQYPSGAGIAVAPRFPDNSDTAERGAVFLVDNNGTLNVLTRDGDASWFGPEQLGPAAAFVPGSSAAVGTLGGDRVAVFLVDAHGQLTMFWAEGRGEWQGPVRLGPSGHISPGARPVVSQQGGTAQLDVFVIDTSGRLAVFWGQIPDGWNGPLAITGPMFNHGQSPSAAIRSSAEPGETDVIVVDDFGDLNLVSVVGAGQWSSPAVLSGGQNYDYTSPALSRRFGSGEMLLLAVDRFAQLVMFAAGESGGWSGPQSIGQPGVAVRGAQVAASQQFGLPAQTDAFVVGADGRLCVFWLGANGGWNGPLPLGPAGMLSTKGSICATQRFGTTDQTEVFAVDTTGEIVMFSVTGGGGWQWKTISADVASPPPAGLGSNSNYLIYNGGEPLLELSVSVLITEPLEVASTSGGDPPSFSFQLNTLTPHGHASSSQQYIVEWSNGVLYPYIDWWDASNKKLLGWPNQWQSLGDFGLPELARLDILLFNDAQQNVRSVRFVVTDQTSGLSATIEQDLLTIPWTPSVAATGLAPIVAFEFDIVGPGDGNQTIFSAGAGTISYGQWGGPLMAINRTPGCVQQRFYTAETADSFYGTLPPLAHDKLTQVFEVSTSRPIVKLPG